MKHYSKMLIDCQQDFIIPSKPLDVRKVKIPDFSQFCKIKKLDYPKPTINETRKFSDQKEKEHFNVDKYLKMAAAWSRRTAGILDSVDSELLASLRMADFGKRKAIETGIPQMVAMQKAPAVHVRHRWAPAVTVTVEHTGPGPVEQFKVMGIVIGTVASTYHPTLPYEASCCLHPSLREGKRFAMYDEATGYLFDHAQDYFGLDRIGNVSK